MNQPSHNNEIDIKIFECPECGLLYKDKNQAEKCKAWCRQHHSCNLAITSQAIIKDK